MMGGPGNLPRGASEQAGRNPGASWEGLGASWETWKSLLEGHYSQLEGTLEPPGKVLVLAGRPGGACWKDIIASWEVPEARWEDPKACQEEGLRASWEEPLEGP